MGSPPYSVVTPLCLAPGESSPGTLGDGVEHPTEFPGRKEWCDTWYLRMPEVQWKKPPRVSFIRLSFIRLAFAAHAALPERGPPCPLGQ